MDEIDKFSLAQYGSLIGNLTARDYRIIGFEAVEPAKRQLILRHDVDMSLEAAVAMAEFEKEIGINSTYFVLLRTEFYNVYSQRGTEQLHRIVALGHDIGLHFDASSGGETPANLSRAATHECEVLESLLGRPVRTFSLHRPDPEALERGLTIEGRISTYDPRFFRDIGYCSDSRGGWHHGHPLEHPAVKEGTALQLLTHPIWWHAHGTESVREKLDRFLLRRFDLLRAELAANCETYPQSFLNSESEN